MKAIFITGLLMIQIWAYSQDVTLLYDMGSEKYIQAANLRYDIYAYADENGLGIYMNEKWKTFSDYSYKVEENTFNVKFDNQNIRDIAISEYGVVFVSTRDDHFLYYENDEWLGGLPVHISGIRSNNDKEVTGIIDFLDYRAPIEVLPDYGEIDFIAPVHFQDELKEQVKAFDPIDVSYNDGYMMVLNADKTSLAYFYESNYEMKEYVSPASYLPCNTFVSFDHLRWSTYNFVAAACEDSGDLHLLRHSISSLAKRGDDLKKEEWTKINTQKLKGKVKGVTMIDRRYSYAREQIIGYTDANEFAIFDYDIKEDRMCVIDIPGSSLIQDMTVIDRNNITVSTGKNVYLIDLTGYRCDQSTSATDISVDNTSLSIIPNPNQGTFYIEGINIENVKSIKIFDTMGKEIYFLNIFEHDNRIEFKENLSSGIYIVNVIDHTNKTLNVKFIKQ